jgi:hypothetical protein
MFKLMTRRNRQELACPARESNVTFAYTCISKGPARTLRRPSLLAAASICPSRSLPRDKRLREPYATLHPTSSSAIQQLAAGARAVV